MEMNKVKYNNTTHMIRQLLLKSEERQTGRVSMISNKISTASNGFEYYYVEIINSQGECHVIEAYGNDANDLEMEVMKIILEDTNEKTKLSYLSASLYCQD